MTFKQFTKTPKLTFTCHENLAAGFTQRITAAVCYESHELPNSKHVQFYDLIQRSDVPDVNEGDPGELHAPAGSHEDSTEGG